MLFHPVAACCCDALPLLAAFRAAVLLFAGEVRAMWGQHCKDSSFNSRTLPERGFNSYEAVYMRWLLERFDLWDSFQYYDFTKAVYDFLTKKSRQKLLDRVVSDTQQRYHFSRPDLAKRCATKEILTCWHTICQEMAEVEAFLHPSVWESMLPCLLRMTYVEDAECGALPKGYKMLIHGKGARDKFLAAFRLRVQHSTMYEDAVAYPTTAAASEQQEKATDQAATGAAAAEAAVVEAPPADEEAPGPEAEHGGEICETAGEAGDAETPDETGQKTEPKVSLDRKTLRLDGTDCGSDAELPAVLNGLPAAPEMPRLGRRR